MGMMNLWGFEKNVGKSSRFALLQTSIELRRLEDLFGHDSDDDGIDVNPETYPDSDIQNELAQENERPLTSPNEIPFCNPIGSTMEGVVQHYTQLHRAYVRDNQVSFRHPRVNLRPRNGGEGSNTDANSAWNNLTLGHLNTLRGRTHNVRIDFREQTFLRYQQATQMLGSNPRVEGLHLYVGQCRERATTSGVNLEDSALYFFDRNTILNHQSNNPQIFDIQLNQQFTQDEVMAMVVGNLGEGDYSTQRMDSSRNARYKLSLRGDWHNSERLITFLNSPLGAQRISDPARRSAIITAIEAAVVGPKFQEGLGRWIAMISGAAALVGLAATIWNVRVTRISLAMTQRSLQMAEQQLAMAKQQMAMMEEQMKMSREQMELMRRQMGGEANQNVLIRGQDLTERMATGSLHPPVFTPVIIETLNTLLPTLVSEKAQAPFLTAPAGAGKTTVMEALAYLTSSQATPAELARLTSLGLRIPPELAATITRHTTHGDVTATRLSLLRIRSLSHAQFTAGARFVGDMQERKTNVVAEMDADFAATGHENILFHDEAHQFRPPAGHSGHYDDLADMFKTETGGDYNGRWRLAYATTNQTAERGRFLHRDGPQDAIARRVVEIAVPPETREGLRSILLNISEGVRDRQHITFEAGAIDRIVAFSMGLRVSGQVAGQPAAGINLFNQIVSTFRTRLAAAPTASSTATISRVDVETIFSGFSTSARESIARGIIQRAGEPVLTPEQLTENLRASARSNMESVISDIFGAPHWAATEGWLQESWINLVVESWEQANPQVRALYLAEGAPRDQIPREYMVSIAREIQRTEPNYHPPVVTTARRQLNQESTVREIEARLFEQHATRFRAMPPDQQRSLMRAINRLANTVFLEWERDGFPINNQAEPNIPSNEYFQRGHTSYVRFENMGFFEQQVSSSQASQNAQSPQQANGPTGAVGAHPVAEPLSEDRVIEVMEDRYPSLTGCTHDTKVALARMVQRHLDSRGITTVTAGVIPEVEMREAMDETFHEIEARRAEAEIAAFANTAEELRERERERRNSPI